MAKIGVQLYTFRDLGESLPEMIYRVADHGYHGVEFGDRIHAADTDAVRTALADTGLEPVAGHASLSRLERDFEDLLERYESVGCSSVVIPHLPTTRLLSTGRIEALADHLSELAARLADRGFELAVHTMKPMHIPVVDGYVPDSLVESATLPTGGWVYLARGMHHAVPDRLLGPTRFEHLVEATAASGLQFEIDVEHAVGMGSDTHRLFEAVGDRLFAIHFSDGRRTRRFPPAYRSTPLGDGYVDLERELRGAVRHGAEWVVAEVDDHPEPRRAYRSMAEAIRDSRDGSA
jgi:sugar phosphate isomerase/epimerase